MHSFVMLAVLSRGVATTMHEYTFRSTHKSAQILFCSPCRGMVSLLLLTFLTLEDERKMESTNKHDRIVLEYPLALMVVFLLCFQPVRLSSMMALVVGVEKYDLHQAYTAFTFHFFS